MSITSPTAARGSVPVTWLLADRMQLANFGLRSGHPSFDQLEQDDRLRFVHLEEHSCMNVDADEYHPRIVCGPV